MRHGSLFSGYGGIDRAIADVFGAETAWVSDVDPGANRILAHRYPDAPNLGDITRVDWTTVEPVDIASDRTPSGHHQRRLTLPRPEHGRTSRRHDPRHALESVGVHAGGNRRPETDLRSLGERPWSHVSKSR